MVPGGDVLGEVALGGQLVVSLMLTIKIKYRRLKINFLVI